MGNVLSSASTRGRATELVTSESETMNDSGSSRDKNENTDEDYTESVHTEARLKSKEEEMTEFRKQLSIKREQRKKVLARHRAEKEELEKSVSIERKAKLELLQANKLLLDLLAKNNIEIPDALQSASEESDLMTTIAQMRDEFEVLKSNNNKLRKDLAESTNTLQNANSDIADLNAQNIEAMKQIGALKDVVAVSKTLISLREQQLDELKNKLNDIEKSLADREASMLSTDLRQEYERQLHNIRTLRGLYEERARLAEVTRLNLVRELDEQKLLAQAEVNKSKNLSEKVTELEDKIEALIETIHNKNHQISVCQDESVGLRAQMTVVNKLFSEVLLGYKSKKDLDQLAHRLEENHGILTQMAEMENDTEASTALPKLLLELVNQVDERDKNKETEIMEDANDNSASQMVSTASDELDKSNATAAEEIVQNLPKVWRVLIELLSHQNVADAPPSNKVTTCYKSVETSTGPVLVPSVSQTYIRLKDLIVEKLTLVKEVNRMKQLNSHLETRLGEQERRLCLVTTELGKTWHVVGRLRRHHHQLHTHEKILKYELQQKRKLLNELKEELEFCREKWDQAKEKNTQSEKDWRKLRAEFSSRKAKLGSPSFNNSGESGYSDERPSDESSESNDESEYVTESPLRCKKKLKKSFETILDSSTDFNPAAEREDPASDMLDVADLPLDTHDESHSEVTQKSEVLNEETEDEVGDITIDSCLDEGSSNNTNCENVNFQNESQTTVSENCTDPKEIMENIRRQNERSAKKDQKLEELEKNSANLLIKVKSVNKFGEQINNTLDHILNQPRSSSATENLCVSKIHNTVTHAGTEIATVPELEKTKMDVHGNCTSVGHKETKYENKDSMQNIENRVQDDEDFIPNVSSESFETISDSSSSVYETPQTSDIDFKSILSSIKKQDERLAAKDKRFETLEKECGEVINNLNCTIRTGEELKDKLEYLHGARTHGDDPEKTAGEANVSDVTTSTADPEPCTSTDIDHEARFAARDLRLRRLEEQTKSLVNKVNKTTSKGVKIHFKLEELHNIYGSESSRAGTPSEDGEEKNNEDETQTE